MIGLNIEQNNDLLKNTSDSVIELLYNISKGLDSNVPQYMKGRLEIVHGYIDAINFLTSKFQDFYISSSQGPYIRFKDNVVQEKLANSYGDGIGLTIQQANSLTANSIMKNLFYNDQNITSFDELSYFTNLRELTYNSFENCKNLESIDLSNIDYLDNRCFRDCNKLKTLKNYQHVRLYGYDVFHSCDLTGEYDFSHVDTSNESESKRIIGLKNNKHLTSVIMPLVKYLCDFGYCESLETLTGLENVINLLYGGFQNCYKLLNLNLPNVEFVGHRCFEHCDAMTLIDLPKLKQCNYSAFNNNAKLIEINVPLLDTMQYSVFSSNPKLETVTIGPITEIPNDTFVNDSSLTTINMNFDLITKISYNAFYGCASLTSLSFPNVTSLGHNAFNGCTSLTTLNIPKLELIMDSNGGQFNGCKKLANNIEFPYLNITNNNAQYMFANCELIPSITFGEVTYIPTKFFAECKSLAYTNIDWTKITFIGDYAFQNCEQLCVNDTINFASLTTSLTNAKLNGFRAPHLKFPAITGMFDKGANGYTQTVEINSNITELGGSFTDCKKLTSVSNLDNVISIGNECFRYDSMLTSLDFSSNLKSIGNYAFQVCNKIEYISTETIYPTSIGNNAFEGCSLLKGRIDLSQCTIIGNSAFQNCTSLTSIGTFNSELTSIGAWAFYNAGITGNLNIPASVTTIGDGCFRKMSSLTSLTFNSLTPPETPTGTQFNESSYIIYVPASAVETYKNAWGAAASRIQAKP